VLPPLVASETPLDPEVVGVEDVVASPVLVSSVDVDVDDVVVDVDDDVDDPDVDDVSPVPSTEGPQAVRDPARRPARRRASDMIRHRRRPHRGRQARRLCMLAACPVCRSCSPS